MVTVTGFVQNAWTGPPDEVNQTATFTVTCIPDSLFTSNGFPSIYPNGTMTYEAKADTSGSATCSVSMQDSGGTDNNGIDTTASSDAGALFTITIDGVNDPPMFSLLSLVFDVLEDDHVSTLAGFRIASNISAGPGSEDSEQHVTFSILCLGGFGFRNSPSVSSDGVLKFASFPNANGVSACTVTLEDDGGINDKSIEKPFNLSITAVNDAPSFILSTPSFSLARFVPGLNDDQHEFIFTSSLSPGPADESSQNVSFEVKITPDIQSPFLENPSVTESCTDVHAQCPFGLSAGQARIKMKLLPCQMTRNLTLSLQVADDGGMSYGGQNVSLIQILHLDVFFVNSPPFFELLSDVLHVTEGSSHRSVFIVNISSQGTCTNETQQQTVTFLVERNTDIEHLFLSAPTISADGILTFDLLQHVSGQASFDVTAKNSGGIAHRGRDFFTRTFTIEVGFVNNPPSFDMKSSTSHFMNSEEISEPNFVYAISKGDDYEQDQRLTFTVTLVSGPKLASNVSVSADGSLQLKLIPNQYGNCTFQVTARDNGTANSESVAKEFVLEVLFKNQAPSFDLIETTLQILEDASCNHDCDFDGLRCIHRQCSMQNFARNISKGPQNDLETSQLLTFMTSPGPPNDGLIKSGSLTIHSNGTLVFELKENQNGVLNVSVYLQDSGERLDNGVDKSHVRNFSIVVIPVNDPPSFRLQTNIFTFAQHSGYQSIPILTGLSTGPANEAAQSVEFFIQRISGLNLFVSPPIVTPDGNLTLTVGDIFGTSNYSIFAVDSGGGKGNTSKSEIFRIEVLYVNQRPSFDIVGPSLVLSNPAGQSLCSTCTAINLCSGCADSADGVVTEKIFSFASGGVNFEDYVAVNISSGTSSEASQNLTFLLSPFDNSDSLFIGGRQPTLDSSGKLRFRISNGTSGRAEYSISLSDNGGRENGGHSMSISAVKLVVLVSKEVLTFAFSVEETVSDDSSRKRLAAVIAASLDVEVWMVELEIVTAATTRRLLAGSRITVTIRVPNKATAASIAYRLQHTSALQSLPDVVLVGNVSSIQVSSLSVTSRNASFDILKRIEVPSGSPPIVVRAEGFVSNIVFASSPHQSSSFGAEMTFVITDVTNVNLFSEYPTVSFDGSLSFSPAAGQVGYSNVSLMAFYQGPLNNKERQFQIVVKPQPVDPSFLFPWSATCVGDGQHDLCSCTGMDEALDGKNCTPATGESTIIVREDSSWNQIDFFAAGISTTHHHVPWASNLLQLMNNSVLSTVMEGQDSRMINGKTPYAFQMAQATTRDGKIFEYTADFVTDSLSVYTYIDGDLHFVQRRREGETSVKYARYQNLEVTSVCGLEAFSIDDRDFLFAASGCEMPKDNVDVLPKRQKYALDRKWEECRSQVTKMACTSLATEPESTLWAIDTVGFWDFSAANFYGEFDRPPSSQDCPEQVETLHVSPAYVTDLRSRLGSAVLAGPACKARSDWDRHTNSSLNLLTFLINNGHHEALMFEERLNKEGVMIASDIDSLLSKEYLPTEKLSLEIWCTLDAEETFFAGIVAAAQSASNFFRGWSLGYSRKSFETILYWSISTQTGTRRVVTYKCPDALCAAGMWIHVVAVYNGTHISLYINGEVVSADIACESPPCGDISYPRVGDGDILNVTPLMIGAYHNARAGVSYPHIGAIKSVQIYRSALSTSNIRARFKIHASLLETPVQMSEYWAATYRGFGLLSPTTLNASAAQSTNMSLYGRFDPGKTYRCQYFAGTEHLLSEPVSVPEIPTDATISSEYEIRCDTPTFPLGHRATRFVLLHRIPPPDVYTRPKWKPVWQRVCTDPRCGYIPVHQRAAGVFLPWDISFGLHKLHGSPVTFSFTALSGLYQWISNDSGKCRGSKCLEKILTVDNAFGSSSAKHFEDGGKHYLLVANYWDGNTTAVDSLLYEIHSGSKVTLSEAQRIPSHAAYKWTRCPTTSLSSMFVLTTFSGGTTIFEWNSTRQQLIELQVIPTQGATSSQCFGLNGSTYLGISQFFDRDTFSHSVDSVLFRWNGTKFQPYQTFPGMGARDFQFFDLDSEYFFVSIAYEMVDYTAIYAWNSDSALFEEYQRLPTNHATSSTFFQVNGTTMLGVAQLSDCKTVQSSIVVQPGEGCSFLYRWDGTNFIGIPDERTSLMHSAGGQALPARADVSHLLHSDPGLQIDEIHRFVLTVGAFENVIEVQRDCIVDHVELFCMHKTRLVKMELWHSEWHHLDQVLMGPSALAVGVDNAFLYVVCHVSRSVPVFSIDPANGHLTYQASLTTLKTLDFDISSIALHATVHGACLYVTSKYPGSLRVYNVSASGSLDLLQTFQHDRTSREISRLIDGLQGASNIAISNDGRSLVLTGYSSNSLSIFNRSLEDGLLEYRERFRDGERTWHDFPRHTVTGAGFTSTTTSGCYFQIGESHFVAVASGAQGGLVLVWSKTEMNFVLFQNLPLSSNVLYIRHFKFSEQDFLFTTTPRLQDTRSGLVNIYRWNSTVKKFQFRDFLQDENSAGQIKYPSRITPFEISGVLFVAVAYMKIDPGSYKVNATVFRWVPDNESFVSHQSLPAYWASDVEFLQAGNDNVLIISDFFTTEENMSTPSTAAELQYTHSSTSSCQQGELQQIYSIWRPTQITGYRRLGDTVSTCSSGQYCPNPPSLLIKDGSWLDEASDFTKIASLDDNNAFWRPVPKAGFVCLGDVVGSNSQKPDKSLLRCVRTDLMITREWQAPIWPKFATSSETSESNSTIDMCTDQIALFDVPTFNGFFVDHSSNSFNQNIISAEKWRIPQHIRAWSLLENPHPPSSTMYLSRATARIYVFDSDSQLFAEHQSIETIGAFDLEAFEIASSFSDDLTVTRSFLAVANRQAQAPYHPNDQFHFDNPPVLYEWRSSRFVELQRLSNVVSVAEDYCAQDGSLCACFDDDSELPSQYWTCESYAAGFLNSGMCVLDDVCNICRVSCAAECDNECQQPGLQERYVRRLDNNWSQSSEVRGATGIHHFVVDEEHFLVIAQSTCDCLDSKEACFDSGRPQPKSTVLQWDGTQFGPLLAIPPTDRLSALDVELSHIHDFSLRISAGAALEWKYMELPAENETVPLLMAFSLTRGIVTFAWEHQTVSGLKGVVDASFGPDGSSLFSLSNGLDNALALFSRLPLLDSTGAVVSDMQFKKSWTEADSNILGFAGASEIEAGSFVSTGFAQGIQNITVKGGLKQHELICSAPPLYRDDSAGDALGSVLKVWQDQYASRCHELVFDVSFQSGSTEILSVPPVMHANGTVKFRVASGKTGSATYNASLYQKGETSPSFSLPFSIKVATANKPPTFQITNVSVDEDCGAVIAPFATELSPGAANEQDQAMTWHFSFTNPGLFKRPPDLFVNGTAGMISFTPATDVFGSSLIVADLEDDGGMHTSSHHGSSLLVGGKMSTQTRFYIHIRSKNDPPRFDLVQNKIFFVDAGSQIVPEFAFGIATGPGNEMSQSASFVLDSVVNAGAAYPGGCTVIQTVDNCPMWENFAPDGGRCCTSRYFLEEPRLGPDGTLYFKTAPFVSGSLSLIFTLVDNGDRGIGDVYNTTKSSVLVILPANHAPAFKLPRPNISIAIPRESSHFAQLADFAVDISAGAPDEEMQKISFQIFLDSGSHLFSKVPQLHLNGTLELMSAIGAVGVARGSVRLTDDGGTLNVGQNTSEPTFFELNLQFVNQPPTLALSSMHVHAVEDQGFTEVPALATDVGPGADDETWQRLSFDLSVLASPSDLFEIHPYIDRSGTLRFAPSQNKFGFSTIHLRLSDDGGTENGGQNQNKQGVLSFTIYIHPQPRVEHVVPFLGSALGGDRVTIHGSHFETLLGKADYDMPCSQVMVYLDGTICSQTVMISAQEIVCVSSPGVGMKTVRVHASNGPTQRHGKMSRAYLQISVLFAGTSNDALGGYLAFGPGYGAGGTHPFVGSVEKPTSAADFFENMSKSTDRSVRAVVSYRGEMYFGGQFARAGTLTAYHIASYNGLDLQPLGGGADGVVNTLSVYGDLLVVGGGFTRVFQSLITSGGIGIRESSAILYTGGLAAWNGDLWVKVGDTPLEGVISAFAVKGSRLYVGGRFNDPERRNNLAFYDGTHWNSLCGGADDACGVTGGEVNAIAIEGEDLFVGGSFIQAGGVEAIHIAHYDGYRWHSLGAFDANVNALCVASGILYIK